MEKQIDIAGLVVGVIGIVVCLVAGVVRLAGSHYLMGFEAYTVFNAGTTLMIAACVLKLQAMSMSRASAAS